MQGIKLSLVLSQLVTLGAWLYVRLCRPPIEGFNAGNWIVVAHLMVAVGLLGSRVFEAGTLLTLFVVESPFIYNLIRYHAEIKAYEATPRKERTGIASKASDLNQRLVDAASLLGAAVVLGFTLYQEHIAFSRWILLAFLPGVGTFLGFLIEAFHAHRRSTE